MTVGDALVELSNGATSLKAAVSYVQASGWTTLRERTANILGKNITLIFTDQFDITQPAAIREAVRQNVKVRMFSGRGTYHPKVFLSYDKKGIPIKFLVGSANISRAALSDSAEASILGGDPTVLQQLDRWFKSLEEDRSVEPTDGYLNRITKQWRAAAYSRIRPIVRKPKTASQVVEQVPLQPSNILVREALEQVFSTVPDDVITLGFDLAGNNIRSIRATIEALNDWQNIVLGKRSEDSKKRSELTTLGLVRDGSLSKLGRELSGERDPKRFAEKWCRWLLTTKEDVNPRLRHARVVFGNYASLHQEVQQYYQDNLPGAMKAGSDERTVLQTIEVLCNVCDFASQLSLEDVKGLTWIVDEHGDLAPHERAAVKKYIENKGKRSWKEPDRRLVPDAWISASNPR